MKSILQMDRDEILALTPDDITRLLTSEELLHIAKILGAFWQYDYQAAKDGRLGLHAELKSGLHSDGFFVSRVFLAAPNILEIIADQLAIIARVEMAGCGVPLPDYVVGIPTGATTLGEKLAEILGVKPATMEKVDGRIKITTELKSGNVIMIVEDVVTRGTATREAIASIFRQQPKTIVMPWVVAIINRGGLRNVEVDASKFSIRAIADAQMNDWTPEECPLCKMGSPPIKPKATDKNWEEITHSQI
jgi:orotate phosphoribosyltransferase